MARVEEVTIPYAYVPRPQQVPVWQAMNSGYTRAILVWHRRYGKDKTCLNLSITKSLQRVGLYAYVFPEFAQGRRILWEGLDYTGFRFRDHFHPSIVARRKDGSLDMDEQEMRVRLANGSIHQIFGSDEYNRLRGLNVVGVVLSEFSYQDPRAWDIIRPILNENGGWAIFNFTPNGKNHAWELLENARRLRERWFTQVLTVEDTVREDGSPVISQEVINEERALGMAEEMIQQEFYCSFEAGQFGSYYGSLMELAEKQGRITRVPWESTVPVVVSFDLGMNDTMVLWFWQIVGREIRAIDFYENSGEGLPHYAKILREKPYAYGQFILPFDASVRELNTGKSREETCWELGLRPTKLAPKLDPNTGIEQVRKLLPRMYFDEENTRLGIKALKAYQKDWDDKQRAFRRNPKHNWASNAADSVRTFAVGYSEMPNVPALPADADVRYDVLRRTAVLPAGGVKWGDDFKPGRRARPLYLDAIR